MLSAWFWLVFLGTFLILKTVAEGLSGLPGAKRSRAGAPEPRSVPTSATAGADVPLRRAA